MEAWIIDACLADAGDNVLCVDLNEKRVKRLRNGEVPICEPGLGGLIIRVRGL